MTRLLVSVRDAIEARIALEAGVDLLDLKEPHRGALGPVDCATANEVVDVVAGRVPVSMALGELLDLSTDEDRSPAVSPGVRFVKAGLARCASHASWRQHLVELSDSLPPSTSLVAVVYADAARVAAPGVDEVLEAALAAKCLAVLVDTAVKDGRGLLDHWSEPTLRRFVDELRRRGLTSVVGGSLNAATIPLAAACGPDYIAVRGAVCRGDRTAAIDAEKIHEIRAVLNN